MTAHRLPIALVLLPVIPLVLGWLTTSDMGWALFLIALTYLGMTLAITELDKYDEIPLWVPGTAPAVVIPVAGLITHLPFSLYFWGGASIGLWAAVFFWWERSRLTIEQFQLYMSVLHLVEKYANAEAMRDRFSYLASAGVSGTLGEAMKDLALNLYWPVMREPPTAPEYPLGPAAIPESDARRYVNQLTARRNYLRTEDAWKLYNAAIDTSIKSFVKHIKGRTGSGPFTTRIMHLLDSVERTVYDLHNPFLEGDEPSPIFAPIRSRYYAARTEVTREMPGGEKRVHDKKYANYWEYAEKFGQDRLLRHFLLSEFRPLFDGTVPVAIPDNIRFAHQWVLGSPRRGKTTLLSMMIAEDLRRVAEGKLSLVIMDSQTKLIETIAHIKDFAPQEPMWKRLIWLRPDVEWPVAINPFHLGETEGLTATQRNALMNGSLEAIAYIFANLKTAVPTERMDFIVKKLARLCFVIPEANIFTFKKLLQKGGLKEFESYIAALPDNEQDFYRDFMENEASWKETTQAVYWRVEDMLSYPMFREMFSATETKLNLYEELGKGRIILIDTSNKFFGDEGTEAYGRMWIALLYRAAQLRAEEEFALPTFVYIDEAHEYIARDIRFKRMLQKVRKQNVGLIIAHQYLSDITDEQVRSAVMNVDVKMVGGVSQADAATIARNMGSTSAQELTTLPSFTFAAHVKDDTFPSHAFPITAHPGAFNEYARANNRDMENLTNVMRHRYHDHRPTRPKPSAKTNFEKEGEGRPKNAREPGSASDDDATGPSASWDTT